jgi:hypothetical protein
MGPNLATQDAATLAAEDASLSQLAANKESVSLAANKDAAALAIERRARFTTLEEEEARLRAQQRRSWLQIALQLAALTAVLAGMVFLAMYITRMPSADQLYATITERGDDDEQASLITVEDEVREFLRQYPNDPRVPEVQRYYERLELDKLERRQRRLRREARESGAADTSLLPAEQLYLKAMDAAETSPDKAAELLQLLVDLYGPRSQAEPSDDDVAAIVALANRRLKSLRDDLAKMHERQLAVLRERLDAALELSKSDATKAARMYRAIIDLHADDDWAKQLVEEARSRLRELDP